MSISWLLIGCAEPRDTGAVVYEAMHGTHTRTSTMDPVHRRALIRARVYLMHGITHPMILTCELEEAGILTNFQVQRIEAGETAYQKTHRLLTLIPTRGPKAFEPFVELLKKHYPPIGRRLEEDVQTLKGVTLYKWKWVAYPDPKSQATFDVEAEVVVNQSAEWTADKSLCELEALNNGADIIDSWGGPELYLIVRDNHCESEVHIVTGEKDLSSSTTPWDTGNISGSGSSTPT